MRSHFNGNNSLCMQHKLGITHATVAVSLSYRNAIVMLYTFIHTAQVRVCI